MRWIYDARTNFGGGVPGLKQVHGFVLDKPARIAAALVQEGVVSRETFETTTAPRDEELSAIHAPSVIAGLRDGAALARVTEFAPLAFLPAFVGRRLVVRPQLVACGGTARALLYAATKEWAFCLAGGFHHARPDLSHGFCLVNDVAWGVHALEVAGFRRKVLVLDLDLHQGDGNAAAFAGRTDVFTVSLHQEDTFPIPKERSNIDVGLPGGRTGDDEYHLALDRLLLRVADQFAPEIIVYVAGTDPFVDDDIGDFSLSEQGLLDRDIKVARFARAQSAALVALPAGGYSPRAPYLSAAGYLAMAAFAQATP